MTADRCRCNHDSQNPIWTPGLTNSHRCTRKAAQTVTVRVENYPELKRLEPAGQHEYDVRMCDGCARFVPVLQ